MARGERGPERPKGYLDNLPHGIVIGDDDKPLVGALLADRKAALIERVAPLIAPADPAADVPDPRGADNLYQYQALVARKIAAARAAGEDPFDLFDPSKPDYVAKPEALTAFQMPSTSATRDSTELQSDSPPDSVEEASNQAIQVADARDNETISDAGQQNSETGTEKSNPQVAQTPAGPNQQSVRKSITPDGRTWVNPTGNDMRGHDAQGDGYFGARRRDDNGKLRVHNGTDYVAQPNQNVLAVTDGKVIAIVPAYPKDPAYYRLVQIRTPDGYVVNEFYVQPDPKIIVGTRVAAGQVIGTAQSLLPKYKDITNHIHVEVRKDDEFVNPQGLIP